MRKLFEFLQIYAIELMKMQELVVMRAGDPGRRIEIMASNLLVCLVIAFIMIYMLGKLIYERHKRRKIWKFYSESTKDILKNDIKDYLMFVIKCIGFLISFLIILDTVFYELYGSWLYAGGESYMNEGVYKNFLKMACLLVSSFVFAFVFPRINKFVLGGEVKKVSRLIWEELILGIFIIAGIMIIKNINGFTREMIFGYLVWCVSVFSICVIWHRIYFMSCGWVRMKRIQYRTSHKKKGGVK